LETSAAFVVFKLKKMALRYFDEIQYGDFRDLEVLVDPDTRELWVTQPVMERMLGWQPESARKKLASKSLKSFAGGRLPPGKSVKAKDISGRPNTFKAVPFDTFLTVVKWLATNKDDTAITLLVAGFADSFTSLVLEQCGVKVTTAERQKVVSFYLTKYHEYQDWIRDTHEALYGYKPDSDYYKAVAIAINRGLFSRWSFNSDRLSNATTEELREIECFERFAMRQTSKYPGVDPLKVTKAVLQDYA
jgi:hypothetical protein